MSTSFNIALSALRALDIKMDVNAHNIANVNTDGFKRSRAHMLEEEHANLILLTEAEAGLRELISGQRVSNDEVLKALS